jgi:hypothetical protein
MQYNFAKFVQQFSRCYFDHQFISIHLFSTLTYTCRIKEIAKRVQVSFELRDSERWTVRRMRSTARGWTCVLSRTLRGAFSLKILVNPMDALAAFVVL